VTGVQTCALPIWLSPKVGFGVDAGGTYVPAMRTLDAVFVARPDGLRLRLAGEDAGIAAPAAALEDLLAAVVQLLAGEARMKALLATRTFPSVRHALMLRPNIVEDARTAAAVSARRAIGRLALRGGRHALGLHVPLGVLTPQRARAGADIAERCGEGMIRLTTNDGVVVTDIADARFTEACARAAEAGLATDPDDPRTFLSACAGAPGCLRADLDTRADAARLGAALVPGGAGRRTIHVSGCGRGCAWPRAADLLLLADGRGGYDLHADADARRPSGAAPRVASIAPADLPAVVSREIARLDSAKATQSR
jgi:sulfite reductase beta subunit-like hemoprotein